MPELPEVETTRKGLEPVFVGARIASVQLRRAGLRIPFPVDFALQVEGRVVEAIARRSKYLLFSLSNGLTMIAHLGMSGSFCVDPGALKPHDHVIFHLGNGRRVHYHDPRRFGLIDLINSSEIETDKRLCHLGVEPLSENLSAAYLKQKLEHKKVHIKTALLDQRVVCGIGNIYASEILHRIGVHPTTLADCLTKGSRAQRTCEALSVAIKQVLDEALQSGGSTLRDFRHTDGELGYFQHRFLVYDREGQSCLKPDCGGSIQKMTQAGRSSYFCAVCQSKKLK